MMVASRWWWVVLAANLRGGGAGRRGGKAMQRSKGSDSTPKTLCKRGAPFGITLVTQTSVDRIRNLRAICERWRGPVSVALYLEDPTATARDLFERVARQATAACAKSAIAMVAPDVTDGSGGEYPVNRLRNMAWARAATSHVWAVDVDFVPSVGALPALLATLARVVASRRKSVALVVPAFALDFRSERTYVSDGSVGAKWDNSFHRGGEVNASEIPGDLAGLSACLATPRDYAPSKRGVPRPAADGGGFFCHPFHHHGSTRYVRWLAASSSAPRSAAPLPLPCFIGSFYEPYVVVRSCGEGAAPPPPPFDEHFAGYGKNKLEWISRLRVANFSFATAPAAFTTHLPHGASDAKRRWAADRGSRKFKGGAVISGARADKDRRFEAALGAGAGDASATPFCAGAATFSFYEHPKRAWPLVANAATNCLDSDAYCENQQRAEADLWARVRAEDAAAGAFAPTGAKKLRRRRAERPGERPAPRRGGAAAGAPLPARVAAGPP